MSLVGTRPPTVDEWEQYELHHRSRMSIKPGITGMWQASGRSDITDFEEVVKLDTEYIEKNTKIAWEILQKEKPDLIISCGAAVAVPFFYLGKLFGAKLVYIEVFDRIDKPTVTGKMVYPVTDRFIVQWEEQKKVYPKAIN